MLPVSLDCPFLIAPLVFSNVYSVISGLQCQWDERFFCELLTFWGWNFNKNILYRFIINLILKVWNEYHHIDQADKKEMHATDMSRTMMIRLGWMGYDV